MSETTDSGSQDAIARLAYELYEAGGCEDGLRDRHWAQARTAIGSLTEPATPAAVGRFLILVRHARRIRTARPEREHRMDGWPQGSRPVATVDEEVGSAKRESGWKKTRSIAVSLAERLDAEKIRVTHILSSEHEVATQTAKVYAAILCRSLPATLGPLPWLSPETFQGYSRPAIEQQLDHLWTMTVPAGTPPTGQEDGGRAIVLIGHQPQLTVIADIVLRGTAKVSWRRVWTRALPLPVGSSEAACLRVDRPRRLRWLLTEKGTPLAKELKDKLKSKVDTAKFFLGALAVNAGLLVNTSVWNSAGSSQLAVLGLGALLIFLGLLFAVATLFGYDALNMPSEFWAEAARLDRRRTAPLAGEIPARRTVLRPPSEATVLLFYEMVNVWNRFFLPALICSVAGVSCFLLTLVMSRFDALHANVPPAASSVPSPPAAGPFPMQRDPWILAAALIVVAAVVVWRFYRERGPKLGLED